MHTLVARLIHLLCHSCTLRGSKKKGFFKLNNDNIEQCYVDEHKVIEVLLSVLIVEEYITLGNDTEQIKSSSHRCNLRNVLRAGINA